MTDYNEPWRVLEAIPEQGVPCRIVAVDRNIAILNEEDELENARRIVACVNLCQHLSNESLEGLLELHVGLATLLQWMRRYRNKIKEENWLGSLTVCVECSHILHYQEASEHDPDCLLGKILKYCPDKHGHLKEKSND